MPWWDPGDEVEADQEAVASCFESPISIVKARGTGDIYRNIEERAKVEAFAKSKCVNLRWGKQVVSEQERARKKERRAQRKKQEEAQPS